MTWPSRQAIVVDGARMGSGYAQSISSASAPAAMGVVAVPHGRTVQVAGTGSQKYSSSVSP
jgi:hypothetical protein